MLRRVESWDHLSSWTTALLGKWTGNIGTAPSVTASAVRNGTNGLREQDWGRQFYLTLDNQDEWYVGAGLRFSLIAGGGHQVISLYDGTTLQTDLRIALDGTLYITRNGTTLGTGTAVLTANTWNYVELGVIIHNSTGIAVARVNGVIDISLSSQDTQNTVNAYANTIRFGSAVSTGGSSVDWDDIYINDGTGSLNNDFLGDIIVEYRAANGNGNSSQLDGSDGNQVDNYLLIDETAPDDDTTYVQSADIGDKDTYTFTDLTTTVGTVYGVQIVPYVRKNSAGSRGMVSVARLSATEEDSANKALTDSYLYQPDIRETKPGGGSWSITDVNNAEFGMKVNS